MWKAARFGGADSQLLRFRIGVDKASRSSGGAELVPPDRKTGLVSKALQRRVNDESRAAP